MIEINNILFDIDGTLIDSRDDIVKAMNYTLRELGLNQKSPKTIVSYVGKGVEYLVSESIGEENKQLFDKAIDTFVNYYLAHCAEQSTLFSHVRETLEYLKEKEMYIITNRKKEAAEIALNKFNLKKYFKDILGADNQECMKPSPCIFDELVSNNYPLNKDKTLLIGDMDIDIKTGKNAGIKTCWVKYGLGKEKNIKELNPDFIINDFSELKNIVRIEKVVRKE